MASPTLASPKSAKHICGSAVILAAIVLMISPRVIYGLIVLALLLGICALFHGRPRTANDGPARKGVA